VVVVVVVVGSVRETSAGSAYRRASPEESIYLYINIPGVGATQQRRSRHRGVPRAPLPLPGARSPRDKPR